MLLVLNQLGKTGIKISDVATKVLSTPVITIVIGYSNSFLKAPFLQASTGSAASTRSGILPIMNCHTEMVTIASGHLMPFAIMLTVATESDATSANRVI